MKIQAVIAKIMAYPNPMGFPGPAKPEVLMVGIPTLEKGVFRDFTPMLRKRFEICGRWQYATHGTWLSIGDMEGLLSDTNDSLINSLKTQIEALKDGWPDHACSLFRPERLSVFSCSDLGNDSIFLLWLDLEDEPELWVYDSNGESRYKNLDEYLSAYLADDLSASTKSWRA